MKLGIIIYSNDRETVWNAFRLAVFAAKQSDDVKIFLLGKGVECESLDTDKFKVTAEMQALVHAGGHILACGTCLKLRNAQSSDICPVSTMADLHKVIASADKVISF